MKLPIGPILLLGLGQTGIILLWTVYDAYVPIFLQAGRPDFGGGQGVRGFGLDPRFTSGVMTLDNLAAFMILPYIGALSDRTRTALGRRRPFILIGAPIAAAAFALVPFALGMPVVLFMGAIIITLLAMDLFRTPLTALMPDIVHPAQRSPANGIITVMGSVGAITGFALGGALYRQSPAAPFLLGAGGMLAGTLAVAVLVREPARPAEAEESPGMLASLKTLFRDRDAGAMLLLGAIFCWFLSFSGLKIFFTRFAINELGVDPGAAVGMMAFYALAILAGAIPSGFAGARFGRRQTIMAGLAVHALVLTWCYTIHSIPLMKVALVLLGFSWSLILVNGLPLVLDFAPRGREGAYTGLFFFASQLSEVMGPLFAGEVLTQGASARVLFIYLPSTLLLAFILMLRVRRKQSADLAPAAA
jgi:maltose/moltooligosaccharide transporter